MQVIAHRWGALAAFGLLSTLPLAVSAAEPCKLLTTEEVGKVLGASVSSSTPLGTTGCVRAAGSQRVSIVLRDAAAWARITAPGPRVTKTDLSGLGEAAQYSGMENVWTLSVKQGAGAIVLTVSGVKTAEQLRSSEESLARIALRRL